MLSTSLQQWGTKGYLKTSSLQILHNCLYYYSDCCVIYYDARLTCVILLTRTSWGLRARVHGHASFYWSALPAPPPPGHGVAWLSSHSSLRSHANWPQIVSSHPVIGVLSSEALNTALEGVMGWSTSTRVGELFKPWGCSWKHSK